MHQTRQIWWNFCNDARNHVEPFCHADILAKALVACVLMVASIRHAKRNAVGR